jgi:hypothetical protein
MQRTGPSRCFPFWQEVLACYVTNTNPEDDSGKTKCQPFLEDYYECLHHKKEVRIHLPFPYYLLLSTSYPSPKPYTFVLLPPPLLIPPLCPPPNPVPTLSLSPLIIFSTPQLTRPQHARTVALQAAYRKQQANIKRDEAPSAGEIRRMGIVDATLEEKNLKPSKWFPHKEIN